MFLFIKKIPIANTKKFNAQRLRSNYKRYLDIYLVPFQWQVQNLPDDWGERQPQRERVAPSYYFGQFFGMYEIEIGSRLRPWFRQCVNTYFLFNVKDMLSFEPSFIGGTWYPVIRGESAGLCALMLRSEVPWSIEKNPLYMLFTELNLRPDRDRPFTIGWRDLIHFDWIHFFWMSGHPVQCILDSAQWDRTEDLYSSSSMQSSCGQLIKSMYLKEFMVKSILRVKVTARSRSSKGHDTRGHSVNHLTWNSYIPKQWGFVHVEIPLINTWYNWSSQTIQPRNTSAIVFFMKH